MALDSLDADRVLRQVSLAFGDEPKARVADRLRALELLGKVSRALDRVSGCA